VRARRQSGFTLVELMVVVAIVALSGALAARMFSRGVRGESAPAFARSAMATLLDARHTAITLGRTTAVQVDGANSMLVTQVYDPIVAKTLVTQSKLALPSSMQLCAPKDGAILNPASPSCPASPSATDTLCFAPNGTVKLITSGKCQATSPATANGATLFFETKTGDKKYRIVVWGLTGMAKVIDTW